MELREAIEEVHKAYDLLGEECCPDDENNPMEVAVCTILNAIVNGTLTPADAVFQVKDGYEVEAYKRVETERRFSMVRSELTEALELRTVEEVRREAVNMMRDMGFISTDTVEAVLAALATKTRRS